jgi:hypothetical protein
MLSFFLAAAVLIALAYYLFGGKEPEEPKGTGAPAKTDTPAKRDRNVGRTRKKGEPDIHEKKVRENAREAFNTATKRVENVEGEKELDEISRESYFLAESLREMFSSDQFFERRTRFDSFHTAIKAAEDVREQLIDRQKKKLRRTNAEAPSASDYVKEKYARHAIESALMIVWCAGGLIGKGKYESAQEIFRVPVSTEDLHSWNQFGQLLRKESKYYMESSTKE